MKRLWFVYLVLFIYFLSAPMVMTYDSAWYHKYLAIFEGSLGWESWDYVRGIAMPLFLMLSHFIFGYSSTGLAVLMGGMFLFCIWVLYQELNRIQFLLLAALFVFNPLIYGYFHVFLPEAFGIFLGLVCFYILSKRDLRLKYIAVIGSVLMLAYQVKESLAIFLVPAIFIGMLIKIGFNKRFINSFLSILIVFLSWEILIKSYLTTKSPLSPTAASKVLKIGIAYGVPLTTMFMDISERGDSILLKMPESKKNELSIGMNTCGGVNKTMFFIDRDSGSTVSCHNPDSIHDAIKINTFFLFKEPMYYLKSYLYNIFEIVRIIDNRYNEIRIIGLYVFSLYGSDRNNITPVEKDYREFVVPYEVKSSKPLGILPRIVERLFGRMNLTLYPFVFIIGFIMCIYRLKKREIEIIDGFVLAGMLYLFISAFLGMVNDRYYLIVYPFALLSFIKCMSSVSQLIISKIVERAFYNSSKRFD